MSAGLVIAIILATAAVVLAIYAFADLRDAFENTLGRDVEGDDH